MSQTYPLTSAASISYTAVPGDVAALWKLAGDQHVLSAAHSGVTADGAFLCRAHVDHPRRRDGGQLCPSLARAT